MCWSPTLTGRDSTCGTQTPSPTGQASRWACGRQLGQLKVGQVEVGQQAQGAGRGGRQEEELQMPETRRLAPLPAANSAPALRCHHPPAEHQQQAAVGGRLGSGRAHSECRVCSRHQQRRAAGGQRGQGQKGGMPGCWLDAGCWLVPAIATLRASTLHACICTQACMRQPAQPLMFNHCYTH